MGFSLTCKYCPDTGNCPVLAFIWEEIELQTELFPESAEDENTRLSLTEWGKGHHLLEYRPVITDVTYASILLSLCFPRRTSKFHRQPWWGGELKLSSCTVNFFATISTGALANCGKDVLGGVVVRAAETEVRRPVCLSLCEERGKRRQGVGGIWRRSQWEESWWEEGRKVMCSYLALLPSTACKRQEKSSKYHQEKKADRESEHLWAGETRNHLVLGCCYVLAKKRRNYQSWRCRDPRRYTFPPPLALYRWYHLVQLMTLTTLHCPHAFAAQFVPRKQRLMRAGGQECGSAEPVEVPKWVWGGPLPTLCFSVVNLSTGCSSAQFRYWTRTKLMYLVEQIGPNLYPWQAVTLVMTFNMTFALFFLYPGFHSAVDFLMPPCALEVAVGWRGVDEALWACGLSTLA